MYNWPNLEAMQVAFFLSRVKESIPWVRCASGNVFNERFNVQNIALNLKILHP